MEWIGRIPPTRTTAQSLLLVLLMNSPLGSKSHPLIEDFTQNATYGQIIRLYHGDHVLTFRVYTPHY
jgi:hypothetical protein